MESRLFEVTITEQHSLILPEDVGERFLNAGHDRVKVRATFEGRSVDFHAAIQKDRLGRHRMTFGKTLQKRLNVFVNDYFSLQFFEDNSKYGVDMPEEMEAVLDSDPEAHEAFEALTPGRKRSLIYHILKIKSSQTRIDKTLLMCVNLKRGITDLKQLFKS